MNLELLLFWRTKFISTTLPIFHLLTKRKHAQMRKVIFSHTNSFPFTCLGLCALNSTGNMIMAIPGLKPGTIEIMNPDATAQVLVIFFSLISLFPSESKNYHNSSAH
jgi:hypothetical protein